MCAATPSHCRRPADSSTVLCNVILSWDCWATGMSANWVPLSKISDNNGFDTASFTSDTDPDTSCIATQYATVCVCVNASCCLGDQAHMVGPSSFVSQRRHWATSRSNSSSHSAMARFAFASKKACVESTIVLDSSTPLMHIARKASRLQNHSNLPRDLATRYRLAVQ